MAYANTEDIKALQPVLDQSGIDLLVVSELRSAAAFIKGRLWVSYSLPITVPATGSILFTANPVDDDEIIVGATTYRFKNVPAQVNDVEIGAAATTTANNLAKALNQEDSGWYTGTEINTEVRATYPQVASAITLWAREDGPAGNVITLDASTSPTTITAFNGGAGNYPILRRINCWIAAANLLKGQAKSNIGGAGTGSLVSGYEATAEDWLAKLEQGDMALVDIDGNVLAMSDDGLATSTTEDMIPFADGGDPIHWGHDDDKDWDR